MIQDVLNIWFVPLVRARRVRKAVRSKFARWRNFPGYETDRRASIPASPRRHWLSVVRSAQYLVRSTQKNAYYFIFILRSGAQFAPNKS